MKYVLTIFLGSCLLFTGYSQVYHPIPTTNAWWNESHWELALHHYHDCDYYTHMAVYPDHEEVANGNTYTVFLANCSTSVTNWGWTCFGGTDTIVYAIIRNDSANHKVYYWDNATSAEKLLYDFDLVIGDTIPSPAGVSNEYCPGAVVTAIDSIDIGGELRKRYAVHCDSCDASSTFNYIIEGIGTNLGLAFCGVIRRIDSLGYRGAQLICFHEPLHDYNPYNHTSDCIQVFGINETIDAHDYIYPIGQNQYLVKMGEGEYCNVTCIDLLGKQLFSKVFADNDLIDLSNLVSGVYAIQISIRGQNCTPLKVMVQH